MWGRGYSVQSSEGEKRGWGLVYGFSRHLIAPTPITKNVGLVEVAMYSRKFSPWKKFTKGSSKVFWKNFTLFIFAHAHEV